MTGLGAVFAYVRTQALLVAALLALALVAGAAHAHEEDVRAFEGEASWYGEQFRGSTTACGEPFDPDAMIAAYPDLDEVPCGSTVRVTNLANGRQVEVRITDEGPHTGDRVLDTSRAAADHLGFRHAGSTRVRGEVLTR